MDFKTMIQQCKDFLGEQYNASPEEEVKLKDKLAKCINYAYERIARNYYHPTKTETVMTDHRCRVSKGSLSESFMYLRWVSLNGVSIASSVEGGDIFVGCRPFSQVEITYSYIPKHLSKDNDIPCIPWGEVSPQVYIFMALSIFCSI